MSVVRTIYANMPLWAKTHVVLSELTVLLDLQRNIPYCLLVTKEKHVQERSVLRTYNGCYVRAAATICWILLYHY
jgi:hypothetical protein